MGGKKRRLMKIVATTSLPAVGHEKDMKRLERTWEDLKGLERMLEVYH